VDVAELEQEVGMLLKTCVKADEGLAIDGKSIRGNIPTGQTRGGYVTIGRLKTAGIIAALLSSMTMPA